jgi:hypothetical protein
VGPQLPRCRQAQVPRDAHPVAQVSSCQLHCAGVKRRLVCWTAAADPQRLAAGLLGIDAEHQRVRDVPQPCRRMGSLDVATGCKAYVQDAALFWLQRTLYCSTGMLQGMEVTIVVTLLNQIRIWQQSSMHLRPPHPGTPWPQWRSDLRAVPRRGARLAGPAPAARRAPPPRDCAPVGRPLAAHPVPGHHLAGFSGRQSDKAEVCEVCEAIAARPGSSDALYATCGALTRCMALQRHAAQRGQREVPAVVVAAVQRRCCLFCLGNRHTPCTGKQHDQGGRLHMTCMQPHVAGPVQRDRRPLRQLGAPPEW